MKIALKKFYFFLILSIGITIALLPVACSSDIENPSKDGKIIGSVADITTGEPVTGANVTLSPGGKSVITGFDGNFSFEQLEAGEYTLEVSKEGYYPNTTNVKVKGGENTPAHILVGRTPSSITSDKTLLEFGEQVETLSFTIVNKGYKDLEYVVITGNCDWLTVEPSEGVLKFEKTETIVVKLLRDKLPMGENEAVIVVRSLSGDGNAEIKVSAINDSSISSVNTLEVSNIGTSYATLNAKIINIGNPKYSERGFVYSLSQNPNVTENIQRISCPINENPEYSCKIENLQIMKTYYVRSYIIQDGETRYGNTLSFTTSQQKTVVTTSAPTGVGANTATLNGTITIAGIPSFTEKGFCYSNTNSTPDISDNKRSVSGSLAGAFSLTLNTLEYPSTYYVRAYAIQGGGVVYGNTISFSTSGQTAVLSTSAVTDIYASHATFNGKILDEGNPSYSERGFCYSRYGIPTISSYKVVANGSGTGNYSAQVNNLDYPATYNMCAYVIQGGEPVYGNMVSFSTETRQPTVRTSAVTDVTSTTATFNGIISDLGIPQAERRGFVYSYSTSNPTIHDDHIDEYVVNMANFSKKVSGLEMGKTYYVRAYAYQDGEYFYGNTVSFTTGKEPTVYTGTPTNLSKQETMFFVSWSVKLNGTVIDAGSPSYTSRGFVYDTYMNPVVSTGTKVTVSGTGTGNYSATITDLQDMKYYYVRAFVQVGSKYYYGESVRISTF